VDTYREITEIDSFWAIGSGRAFALGAMDAVYDDPERDAESVARLGVSAGCKFNTYCSEPIDSFAIALEDEESENELKNKSERKVARK
jgi:ATP-dependent HslUV protease subunit HslV